MNVRADGDALESSHATVAVTGADGFVGRHLCVELERRGHRVRRIVRHREGPGIERVVIPDLAVADSLESALRGGDAVIHLAGRAHVVREREQDPAAAFRRSNVDATTGVAQAAIAAGVRRFVFVSSIGVNGGSTAGAPFTEEDKPAPHDLYACSKFEAERALHDVGSGQLELVVVRPSLVYGAGVKGNFRRLLALVQSGWPLPFGSVANRRSFVGVENLCDLLALCVERPAAAGELFLAGEPRSRTTAELLQAMSAALQRPSRVFPFPVAPMRAVAKVAGIGVELDKLCASLEVSSTKASRLLGWQPRIGFEDGIARMAAWFRGGGHAGR